MSDRRASAGRTTWRSFSVALVLAGVVVAAPALLDRLTGVDATVVLLPLLPGMWLGGLLERLRPGGAFDASGDLTWVSTLLMYGGSIFFWLVSSWTALVLKAFTRKERKTA